uniref:tRNA (uracil-O(2)-)-methyltransferase n=1 Tax=Sinocyclocheilus anshuiensis TaxID=1608454 RepID=A0A671QDI0_9TELE
MRSSSSPEVSREKGTTLRKRTNKDNFRCLISIWSIGNARRGLNELIFVKTSNSTKTPQFCERKYTIFSQNTQERHCPLQIARAASTVAIFWFKERRRTPPYLGFETAESRAFEALVQNDYTKANPLTHQTGRLVYLRGFKGCLFPHSGSPTPQALPEICIRGDSVSIHGPTLRSIPGPSYVYEVHGCCSLSSEAERNAHPELSRRLASLRPIREGAAQRQAQTSRSCSELRAGHNTICFPPRNTGRGGENAITPSNDFLFPTTDWLIGNHSDELTPWIPVIAARSSYSCRYFVLPCCFFDFCGKYQRRQCKKSQYKEYIDFISDVSTECGFYTVEDCLRIPSTKRVCIIGKGRKYREAEEALVEKRRSDYIRRREALFTNSGVSMNVNQSGHYRPNDNGQNISTPANDWVNGFQPREKTETIRNCTALPRDFVNEVVLRVAKALLSLTESNTESSNCGDAWNTGGSLLISEVVNLLDQSSLQALKKECGGLQTLLKNNYQVFRVEGGSVFIRDWRVHTPAQSSRVRSKRKPPPTGALKTRLCWFHIHHPHGCPLPREHCAFAHGETDFKNP